MTRSSHHCQYMYQASAYGLAGEIERPVRQSVPTQASTILVGSGGRTSQRVKNFNLIPFLSFHEAYTEVGGSYDECQNVHTSFAYSVIEGLNIADIVTADRVVSRMVIHSPKEGEHSYDITGSYFENLRIAGHKVEIDLIGQSNEQVFIAQCKHFEDQHFSSLEEKIDEILEEKIDEIAIEEHDTPHWLLDALRELRGTAELSPSFHSRCQEAMYTALSIRAPKELHIQEKKGVEYLDLFGEKSINDGSRKCKNRAYSIRVPKFGVVHLFELLVERSAVRLTMLRVQLASGATGNFNVADAEIVWAESHQKPADGLPGPSDQSFHQ